MNTALPYPVVGISEANIKLIHGFEDGPERVD
jgi:hypothetical protein